MIILTGPKLIQACDYLHDGSFYDISVIEESTRISKLY